MDQAPLQRHFSDSLAFAPRQPSRLGPGRRQLPQGTVSLPTSPVMGSRQAEAVWNEPPVFSFREAEVNAVAAKESHPRLAVDFAPWYANAYPSSSDSIPLSSDGRFAHHLPHQPERQTANVEHSGGPAGGGVPVRKKRAQVRIACTHCQKACKKCSNVRPCERCVKYGLKDCVDSTRKPRKTGVKRGPYKRRASAKYSGSFYASSSPPPSQASSLSQHPVYQPTHAINYLQAAYPSPQPRGAGPATQLQQSDGGRDGYISPPEPTTDASTISPHYQHQPPLGQPGHPTFYALPENQLRLGPGDMGVPPGPRTAALQGAFAQALSGPRWVHGRRTGPMASGEVMYPPTSVVPFPISLHHRDDPFSRAVSPIRGDLDTALQHLKPGMANAQQGQQQYCDPDANLQSSIPFDGAMTNHAQADRAPVFIDPFQRASQQQDVSRASYAYSAPASPRMRAAEWADSSPGQGQAQVPRSSSADLPSATSNAWQALSPHPLSMPTGGPYEISHAASPAFIALTKIRKPSLRTLMSHGGSQAPSRQVSPILESPTLFDQPMEMDDTDAMGAGMNLGVMSAPWDGSSKVDDGQARDDGSTDIPGPFDNSFFQS